MKIEKKTTKINKTTMKFKKMKQKIIKQIFEKRKILLFSLFKKRKRKNVKTI